VTSLRPACSADFDACIAVFQRAVAQLTDTHYDAAQRRAWAPPTPDRAVWHARLASLQLWLVERDQQVLGFIGYELSGHIDLLYCAPQAARQGVATRLYRHAEQQLSQAGVRRVWTEASLVAVPFFVRHGFVLRARQLVQRDGVGLLRCDMDKVLAE
tara:strand:- start:2685 stop:3155 length:471 start_codon:yes stop_codon:yes gene_type:complete